MPESSRLEFVEKFLANNFVLSGVEGKTSGSLNRRGIAELPLLKTLLAIRQKSREPSFWEVMDSFVLLAYASLAASRTLLQQLLACLNFTLDSEDLFCWYKWKKWFLWTMAPSQAAKHHGDESGLTWYLRWGIYTSIPTWTNSKNSLAAAEALSRVHYFHQIFSAIFIIMFLPNDSPSKIIKNAFYFVWKALLVLEIFRFLYICPSLFFCLSAIALWRHQLSK